MGCWWRVAKAPAARKKSRGWSGRSFVPYGTRFRLAQQPSDESLGYFRTSLRDVDSRQAKIVTASSTTAEGGSAPQRDFWRTDSITESTQRRRGAKARRKNPKGISSFSPGLRSYPGLTTQTIPNPNGVLAGVRCTGTQPRWGCGPLDSGTQGSSSLATLGWRLESLWDSPGLDSCGAPQRESRHDNRPSFQPCQANIFRPVSVFTAS